MEAMWAKASDRIAEKAGRQPKSRDGRVSLGATCTTGLTHLQGFPGAGVLD